MKHLFFVSAASLCAALSFFGQVRAQTSNPSRAYESKARPSGRVLNVDAEPLQKCSEQPLTGFYRDGFCSTGPTDRGTHVVCAEMTAEFLSFTKSRGNDLETPAPRHRFPGLKPGDRWCLCAARWREALEAERAPPVLLKATEVSAVRFVSAEALKAHRLRSPRSPSD